MPLIRDATAFQKRLAALPVAIYQAGDTVLAAGSTTGRLFILRRGAVEIVKDGMQIARVSEPGAVFGELAVLLDKPHTADMRALERSEFHVADAGVLLAEDPTAVVYVAAILARRLEGANDALVGVKRQLQAGESRRTIGKAIEGVEALLSTGGGTSLLYAGYPYDPLGPSAPMH